MVSSVCSVALYATNFKNHILLAEMTKIIWALGT